MAASDVIGSGTAKGMFAFFDYLMDRGIATTSAVNPWKSAAKQVLSRVEDSDDFGDVDVQTLDVDEYMNRFVNKSRGDYKPDSLNAYSKRFRRGVEAYRGYLDDPVGWRPNLRTSPSRRPDAGTNGRTGGESPAGRGTDERASAPARSVTPAAPPSGLIDYPFPLRSGQLAHLHLPSPLEKEDAERLTQYVRALVFEQQAQLPSGEESDGE